ncbi:hypothetical protein [Brenneria rubrifaciens]|nr:hypothetical protein [Brenneria rubrifaciens]
MSDGELTIAESRNIIGYLIDNYGEDAGQFRSRLASANTSNEQNI